MPRRGRRRIVFRHALLEALDALGDVAHHIGKAPLAEQQQDDHAENEPAPDAQTTHPTSPCAAPIGAAVSTCRSEARRGGKGCIRTCGVQWSRATKINTTQ